MDAFAAQSHARVIAAQKAGRLGTAHDGISAEIAPLFDAKGITRLPRADKLTLARQIVAAIADRIPGTRP